MKDIVTIVVLVVLVFGGCESKDGDADVGNGKFAGRLVIFHAGSLTIPMEAMSKAFCQQHPGVDVFCESAGSRHCARKICDLGKRCDVMASADGKVIKNLLMPKFAGWYIEFANNELVLVYNAKKMGQVTIENLPDKLLQRDNIYRSDPDLDPCGYRTLMVWQLMEKYYNRPGLYDKLLVISGANKTRPKETDLLSLFEIGQIDCFFIYRSVAQQHSLAYLELPDEVNLSDPKLADLYAQAKVEVSGSTPGETLTLTGAPIVYGLTIPVNSEQPELAAAFVRFMVGREGQKILESNGQGTLRNIIPEKSAVPTELLKETN